MEFYIGETVRIINRTDSLNGKLGTIIEKNKGYYTLQLCNSYMAHNIAKVDTVLVRNSEIELLHDTENFNEDTNKNQTVFNFTDNKLSIKIGRECDFDKYLLLESIEDFIKIKYYNVNDLLHLISRAVAISKNYFKDVFSNLYESVCNWKPETIDDDIYFLRDIFLLLSVNGYRINQKDFDILQNKDFYEGLSYKVVIIKND